MLTGTINDVTLSADSITKATTTSTAGGEAKGGSGVGIGGAISITVANTDTKAYIGSGDTLTLGGDLSATATHRGARRPRRTGRLPGGARRWALRLG